jgi:RNA polymerase sigma factor (sigma-70 family)
MYNRVWPDFLFGIQDAEIEDALTEAILQLPDHERLVFTLYYYEELTTEEIGFVLGEPEARAFQVHASALMHLETRLADS